MTKSAQRGDDVPEVIPAQVHTCGFGATRLGPGVRAAVAQVTDG